MEQLSSYFHPIETGDAEIFLAGAIKLFSRYPQEVIDNALDVSIGLPAKHKWWPRISEMKETLDELHWPIKFAEQWDKQAAKQIAERPKTAAIEDRASPRPPQQPLEWQPGFGCTKEQWDAIPNLPDDFMKLPTPKITKD